MPEDCIFCKIVKGEIPSQKVYEDQDTLAFLDIHPANKGHALVITKQHYPTFIEVPEELMQKLVTATQKVAAAVVKATQAEGFNVLMNNHKVSGQLVPHAHFHIIPRFTQDGVRFSLPENQYQEKEMEQYREKIKQLI